MKLKKGLNIGFANQKGGVGKSTLALLFAGFLEELDVPLMCFDFDPQGSLSSKWSAAYKHLTDDVLVKVYKCNIDEATQLLEAIDGKNEIKIFDFPGLLDDNYQELFDAMDLIICPFQLEQSSFESTGNFVQILKEIEIEAEIVFIPNCVSKSFRYDIKEQVSEAFAPFGATTPDIYYWKDMQEITFFNSTERQKRNVEGSFDFILQNYLTI